MNPPMSAYPVTYTQAPPEQRSRLTIFFRLIMVIPHYIWGMIYAIGYFFVVFAAWFVLLFTGRWPRGMYDFTAGFLRFWGRLNAYTYLVVDAYPPFDGGEHPEYPVRVHIGEPQEHYSRVLVLFRIILMIPVYVMAYIFSLWISAVSIALWFVGVIMGRTSPGLTDAMRLPMAYTTRAMAYYSLVTEGFPPFDPGPKQLSTSGPSSLEGGSHGGVGGGVGGPESLR